MITRFLHITIVFLALLIPQSLIAQTNKKTTTPQKKSVAVKSNTQTPKTTVTKAATSKNKTTQNNKKVYSNADIKKLEKERGQLQRKIREQQQLLKKNRANVKKSLDNLAVINSDITTKNKSISNIQQDISLLDNNISVLEKQIETLDKQLQERKERYVRSTRFMNRNNKVQDQMMFIFSSQSLTQFYRRMRFVREYAAYQKVQGELVKSKQEEITAKHQELQTVKDRKNVLLNKSKQEKNELEAKQTEEKNLVQDLQKQQKVIQSIISEQQKQDAAINAKIEQLIAQEIAKAKARAEAEAKKRAEAIAAAKKKKAEELARKKAEAETAAKENARRIAAAKTAEEKKAAQLKADIDKKRHEKEIAKAKKEIAVNDNFSSEDRKLSANFEANKGRLPMPITGNYKIVSHYGRYNVEGLSNVSLENKGINIQGSSGCQARAIFNGEVSGVFGFGGKMVVMIRHGEYISVYLNLSSVSVGKGQRVSTRQSLGAVGSNNILQFQLRKQTAKINPELWLGK